MAKGIGVDLEVVDAEACKWRHPLISTHNLMSTRRIRLHWKADLITEYTPFETELEHVVKIDKSFIGKEALEMMIAKVQDGR